MEELLLLSCALEIEKVLPKRRYKVKAGRATVRVLEEAAEVGHDHPFVSSISSSLVVASYL